MRLLDEARKWSTPREYVDRPKPDVSVVYAGPIAFYALSDRMKPVHDLYERLLDALGVK